MDGHEWFTSALEEIDMDRLLPIVAAAGMTIGLVTSTLADEPGPGDPGTPGDNLPGNSVSVESNDDGVTIYIGVTDTSPGSSGDPSSGGTGVDYSTWSCTADVMNIGQATLNWFLEEAPKHPGEAPWVVRCDDGFFAIVWLPINTEPADIDIVVGPAEPVDPVTIAAELLDHVPVPNITIGSNPDVGLVALPSWFWVTGYDGSPIMTSDTLGDVTVEVEVTPTGYRWSFGDGATLETSSLGQAYPETSDIRHTYEQSSLGTSGAFAVTVDIGFSVRYRVNGGDWEPLKPISRSFSDAYSVQQLQSVLTGR